jgi:8-oxo-dGTP diphosphatase
MARHSVSITTDVVLISAGAILVVKRKNPPFQDQWALPGGYVDEGEFFIEAAVRELKEETGVVLKPWQLTRLMVRDDPERDPRGRVISQPFRAYSSVRPKFMAGDDAAECSWWPMKQAGLAFDHDLIVREAINAYL